MANVAYLAVTPSDTAPLPGGAFAIYVGAAGDVAIKSSADSDAVTLKAPANGIWIDLPHPILFVMATGTTATSIFVALATSARQIARRT